MVVPADPGHSVAVRVVIVGGDDAGTYQRVTLPAAADLDETTLVLIPKLMKLTTSDYYVNFDDNQETIMFDFAAAVAGENGKPGATIHASDVTLGTAGDFVIVGTTSKSVTIRSNAARAATSASTTVDLDAEYAMPTDPTTDGQATLIFDDTGANCNSNSWHNTGCLCTPW